MNTVDIEFLRAAIRAAQRARESGDQPFGAVLADSDGRLLLEAENSIFTEGDCTAHAETNLARMASRKFDSKFLETCTLYASTEPCAMCAAAISFARIRRVVFGALDPKGGGILHGGKFYEQPTCHHRPKVLHLETPECGQILKDYFKTKRR